MASAGVLEEAQPKRSSRLAAAGRSQNVVGASRGRRNAAVLHEHSIMSTMSVNNSLASYKDIFSSPFTWVPDYPAWGLPVFGGLPTLFTRLLIQIFSYPLTPWLADSASRRVVF